MHLWVEADRLCVRVLCFLPVCGKSKMGDAGSISLQVRHCWVSTGLGLHRGVDAHDALDPPLTVFGY